MPEIQHPESVANVLKESSFKTTYAMTAVTVVLSAQIQLVHHVMTGIFLQKQAFVNLAFQVV